LTILLMVLSATMNALIGNSPPFLALACCGKWRKQKLACFRLLECF